MIVTITFNPSLDYFVTVDNFQIGVTNRTTSELLLPGGKGINVSTVLSHLGIASRAICFTAGFVGDEIIRLVRQEGIEVDAIPVEKGCSRLNLKLRSADGTEINGMGPEISAEKVEQMMRKLESLSDGDTLILAGTVPGSMSQTIYRDILERVKEKKLQIVVDATKELLLDTLPYHPWLIKPNHHELSELFADELKGRTFSGSTEEGLEEIRGYMQRLQEKGARNILCSLGKDGASLLSENGEYFHAAAPEIPGKPVISTVGCGDSMVAGFLAGILEKNDREYAFRLGLAAGSAGAYSDRLATGDEVRGMMDSMSF